MVQEYVTKEAQKFNNSIEILIKELRNKDLYSENNFFYRKINELEKSAKERGADFTILNQKVEDLKIRFYSMTGQSKGKLRGIPKITDNAKLAPVEQEIRILYEQKSKIDPKDSTQIEKIDAKIKDLCNLYDKIEKNSELSSQESKILDDLTFKMKELIRLNDIFIEVIKNEDPLKLPEKYRSFFEIDGEFSQINYMVFRDSLVSFYKAAYLRGVEGLEQTYAAFFNISIINQSGTAIRGVNKSYSPDAVSSFILEVSKIKGISDINLGVKFAPNQDIYNQIKALSEKYFGEYSDSMLKRFYGVSDGVIPVYLKNLDFFENYNTPLYLKDLIRLRNGSTIAPPYRGLVSIDNIINSAKKSSHLKRIYNYPEVLRLKEMYSFLFDYTSTNQSLDPLPFKRKIGAFPKLSKLLETPFSNLSSLEQKCILELKGNIQFTLETLDYKIMKAEFNEFITNIKNNGGIVPEKAIIAFEKGGKFKGPLKAIENANKEKSPGLTTFTNDKAEILLQKSNLNPESQLIEPKGIKVPSTQYYISWFERFYTRFNPFLSPSKMTFSGFKTGTESYIDKATDITEKLPFEFRFKRRFTGIVPILALFAAGYAASVTYNFISTSSEAIEDIKKEIKNTKCKISILDKYLRLDSLDLFKNINLLLKEDVIEGRSIKNMELYYKLQDALQSLEPLDNISEKVENILKLNLTKEQDETRKIELKLILSKISNETTKEEYDLILVDLSSLLGKLNLFRHDSKAPVTLQKTAPQLKINDDTIDKMKALILRLSELAKKNPSNSPTIKRQVERMISKFNNGNKESPQDFNYRILSSSSAAPQGYEKIEDAGDYSIYYKANAKGLNPDQTKKLEDILSIYSKSEENSKNLNLSKFEEKIKGTELETFLLNMPKTKEWLAKNLTDIDPKKIYDKFIHDEYIIDNPYDLTAGDFE